MYDLIVVGGGPAGASAAITAARSGASVLVLERAKYPRHKVCGEFVSAESLGLLRNLLAAPYQSLLDGAIRISEGRIFLDGRLLHAPVDPPAASIARFDLDEVLYQSALAAGVKIRVQTTVQAISGSVTFRVSTPAEEFEARAVINASGRWSNLTAAPVANAEKWLGIKAHYAEIAPAPSVDLYFFEGGYCGVQPVTLRTDHSSHGRVNAAAMVRADVASSLPQILSLNPALADRSREWQLLSDPVTTSPLIFRKPQPVRDGVLNAGDAAAFVDPFVGDGISLALRSGALAAECMGSPELYAQQYQRRFGPVFRASSQLRRLLRLPQQIRKPILSVLEHTPAVTEFFVTRTR
ncbi:MAG TPA: FAD-dependent oxidoreductase [Terriglobales bacterium]|jgi:flavin-dependent dehydrogenase|nr:FAD-dependent oxidoreductase [Terriglobales bacterium]